MRMLTRVEEAILLLIKAYPKGSYEKIEDGYLFEFGEDKRCSAVISSEAIEFKIHTLKWIPGNYEPIEGSELYERVEYNELDKLSEEEKAQKIRAIIEKIV